MDFTRKILLLSCLALAACDPDTSPIVSEQVDGGEDGAAGAAGTGGSAGGTAGTGGDAGQAGSAGSAGVAGSAGSDAGDDGAVDGSAGTGGATGYTHTIAIDGTNDFDLTKEKFSTSSKSPDYTSYVSWDATSLYLGIEGEAIGQKSSSDFFIAYLDGTPGSTAGLSYGAQSPTLPFSAKVHIRWKCDGTYTNMQLWNGTAWADSGIPLDAKSSGNFLELRLLLTSIGSPGKVKLLTSMIREKSGSEWTWAATPAVSMVDGLDPNYVKYFEFDFAAAQPPSQYTPFP